MWPLRKAHLYKYSKSSTCCLRIINILLPRQFASVSSGRLYYRKERQPLITGVFPLRDIPAPRIRDTIIEGGVVMIRVDCWGWLKIHVFIEGRTRDRSAFYWLLHELIFRLWLMYNKQIISAQSSSKVSQNSLLYIFDFKWSRYLI